MEANKTPRHQTLQGHGYILVAAVLWGTTGTAQALAPSGSSPMAIGAARLLVGGLALLFSAAVRGGLRQKGSWPLLATSAAASSMAAYQLFFFAAVARTGVAIGTVVAIGSAPVLAGGLARLVYGEKPGRRWLGATMLATLGCGLLVIVGQRIQLELAGILMALAAGLTYAVYSIASKSLLRDQSPDIAMAVVFCLGALFLLPLLFILDLSWLAQLRGLAVIMHLGLIATAVAYSLFARGLAVIPVATAVTLSLAEPLTAGTLGIWLLGEQLTLATAAGIGLLLAGLGMLSLGEAADSVKEKR